MLKYIATAMVLKAFSLGPLPKRMYRALGNRVGNERRGKGPMPGYYVERVRRMLSLACRHGVVRDGDRILELGTGWLHWEAVTLRLFFDVQAVLFDVWDNRQLGGMKNYLRQLGPHLDRFEELSPGQLGRAKRLIREVVEVQSFDELYRLLGFEYVVDGSGRLTKIPAETFDLVVSAGVLEHVYEDALPMLIADTRRVLRPGGWAVHSIDTSDHLSHYDHGVSPKLYLSFSERAWRHLLDNDVQHINRVQRGEWLALLECNGFALVEEECRRVDMSTLKLARRFSTADRSDLECTVIRLALKAV